MLFPGSMATGSSSQGRRQRGRPTHKRCSRKVAEVVPVLSAGGPLDGGLSGGAATPVGKGRRGIFADDHHTPHGGVGAGYLAFRDRSSADGDFVRLGGLAEVHCPARGRAVLCAMYRPKHHRAAAYPVDDGEALVTHFALSGVRCHHSLRTKPVVSLFATVRYCQRVTKGPVRRRRGSRWRPSWL